MEFVEALTHVAILVYFVIMIVFFVVMLVQTIRNK